MTKEVEWVKEKVLNYHYCGLEVIIYGPLIFFLSSFYLKWYFENFGRQISLSIPGIFAMLFIFYLIGFSSFIIVTLMGENTLSNLIGYLVSPFFNFTYKLTNMVGIAVSIISLYVRHFLFGYPLYKEVQYPKTQ